MTITRTINIPADRRITVPLDVPTGPVILTFTPARTLNEPTGQNFQNSLKKPRMTEEEELELINRHADELNHEALDALSYQVDLW